MPMDIIRTTANEDFQNEMNQINSWFADDEISFAEYDDEIVRYLVESIHVSDERNNFMPIIIGS